ncbi:MAG TPA: monovalent cation/H(+) antiporter subunit G [Chthoniobacterales bacterium]|nr:monovalent cation/H(+) antiporter subunit G [Chthoniobacterales bacterium]
MRELTVIAALLGAVAVAWICCVGLVAMRNPYDRLHAIAPANILPPLFLVIAVFAARGFSIATIKVLLLAAALIFASPIVTQALARAARLRETGRLELEK